jgi:hypothetical protein
MKAAVIAPKGIIFNLCEMLKETFDKAQNTLPPNYEQNNSADEKDMVVVLIYILI